MGIGAGLAQYRGLPAESRKGSDVRIKTVGSLHSSSPRLSAMDSPRLESIPEPLHRAIGSKENVLKPLPSSSLNTEQGRPEKTSLRIDAFLGEWLSPDYFENITHPPNSLMMVTGARANLSRTGEDIASYTPTAPKAAGMWGTPVPSAASSSSPSRDPSSRTGHKRDRSNSHGSGIAASSSRSHGGRSSTFSKAQPENSGYIPPTPTYAVSPVDPIPKGYVAHAKDACVDVDYQWNSMREPHNWGDGGAYGEEWGAMHKRFRRGLNSMLEYYTEGHDEQTSQQNENDGEEATEEEDDDTDQVLVLVTHGAGCNALIGALTNHPVLIDVGMASLTMAVRRENGEYSSSSSTASTPAAEDSDTPSQTRPLVRRKSTDPGPSHMYELKLIASSDHLRPGVDPAQTGTPTPSSPRLASQKIPEYRRRYGSTQGPAGASVESSSWNSNESIGRSASTVGPSGMRRGSVATAAPQKMRTYSLAAATLVHSALEEMRISTGSPTTGGSGLWGSSTAVNKPPSPEQEFKLDFATSPESSLPSSRPISPPSSRPSSATGTLLASTDRNEDVSPKATPGTLTPGEKHAAEEVAEVQRESESAVSDLPPVAPTVPHSLGRSLSQKGLWGSAPSGVVLRERGAGKRRWTLQPEGQ